MARTAICGALGAWLAVSSAQAAPVFGGSVQASADGQAPSVSTGAQTTVTLRAQRTVVDWASFDVAEGETVRFDFNARSWIVLNRITGAAPTIDGTIQGMVGGEFGGNVWFSSPNGMIFGPNAVVDAGGLLATTSSLDASRFLDAGRTQFDFDVGFGARSSVTLNGGARLTGHGGLIALVAPEVLSDAGASVTGLGGGDVLYGGAQTFRLSLAQGSSGDFDMVDFIIANADDGSSSVGPIDLRGATTANSVFVASVGRGGLASSVINLAGAVTARAAVADGGDVILSGGGGIVGGAPQPVSGAALTDLYHTNVSASRDVKARTNGQMFGKPWVRPPREPDPPPYDPYEECVDYHDCYYYGGNDNVLDEDFGGGFQPLLSVADGAQISTMNAARDVQLTAEGDIALGRVSAGGRLSVSAPTLRVNAATAQGDLTVASQRNAAVSLVAVGGAGRLTAGGDLQIDQMAVGAQRVTLRAGGDLQLGDGSGVFSGPGLLDLTGRNVFVTVGGSIGIDRVEATNIARFQATNLDVATISAGRVLARASSVRLGVVSSGADIYAVATNGDALVGSATSGDDIFVLANGGTASLARGSLVGPLNDAVAFSFEGNPDTLNGRVVLVKSVGGDARLGLGSGTVTGADRVTVEAGQDAVVDLFNSVSGTLSISAGRDATFRAPAVTFDAVRAGRDLSLFTTGGDFESLTPLSAAHSISLGASGALRVGDVRADTGSVTLIGATVSAGAVSAAQDLTLRATGGGVAVTSYQAGQDLILQGDSLALGSAIRPVGRDLSITTPGDFAPAQDLSAGRNIKLTAGGVAALARNVTAGAAVTVAARDIVLTGAITAPTIQIESLAGPLRVGGSAGDAAPAGGMWLDNGEFGRMRASAQLKLYAGSTTGNGRGDLTVANLDVNPQATPQVLLYAGNANTVRVTGIAAPTVSGGQFRIGDPTGSAWRPNSILVTGSLGFAQFQGGGYAGVRAFDDLRLFATRDILMGSQRFIDLVRNVAPEGIDVGRNLPNGVMPTPDEQSRVSIAAGVLEVSAEGKVVQQNTSPIAGTPVGIYLSTRVTPALIIDPPVLVDLFGAYVDPPTGRVVSNFGNLPYQVVNAQGQPIPPPSGASYRFNSCNVGNGVCAGGAAAGAGAGGAGGGGEAGAASGALLLTAPISLPSSGSDDSSEGDPGAAAAESASLATPPVLIAVGAPTTDEVLQDPVAAGTGNEEIWRKQRIKGTTQ